MHSPMSYNTIMQAYVGLAEDLNAIVIAFRGTQENRFVLCCVGHCLALV